MIIFPIKQLSMQVFSNGRFNEIDGVPATGNKWLMTEVLRNQWGFKGFVVTDYTGILK
jgi:beta-glucosidase-like glycosyl hydrolase